MTIPGRACPLCHGVEVQLLRGFDRHGYRYLRCRRCGLGRIDPAPPDSVLPRGYFDGSVGSTGDGRVTETWRRESARSRLELLSQHVPAGKAVRIVDVGAALGYVTAEAAARGWQADVVEPPGWKTEPGSRPAGSRVVSDLSELADPADAEGAVDAVTFFQILDRLPNPLTELRKAHRLLRPGGVVMVEGWDAASRTARLAGWRWQRFDAPSVLWLFTPEGTRTLMADAGFEPVSWKPTPQVFSAASVVGAVAGSGGVAGRAARAVRAVTARIPVPYALDDLVTFVARRPPAV